MLQKTASQFFYNYRPFNKVRYLVLLLDSNGLWYLLILKSVVTCTVKTCLNRTPLGLKNLFILDRFKLHRHLVDGTVKCVWLRQVFGLLRVWFRQVFGLLRVQFRQVSISLYKISMKIFKF
jgi:hypothetical protein